VSVSQNTAVFCVIMSWKAGG